ncbi:MAG: nitroreductase/quinone reductase family protein [Acidimicrobiia bacterium]
MEINQDELQLIADAREVRIVTRGGGRSYRTVIWVVVDQGEVFVRSLRGEHGKWYQRVREDPDVVLEGAGTKVSLRAVPASDEASVTRTSEALRRKYGKDKSLDFMLAPETLATTMRLEPT